MSKSLIEALVSLGMFFVTFVASVLGGILGVILGKIFRQFFRRFWRWVFRHFFKCFWHFSKEFQLSKIFDLSSFDLVVQLRDPKNDFIFNFNFDDKMKNLWTVWISCKINQHYSTPEKMSWANAHLNLCKLLETELRLTQRLAQFL